MPKSKGRDRGDEPERKHEHEGSPRHEHKRHRRPRREPEESGDDPKRHASIIARRWLGSPRPNAKQYALALRQWQNLPGAVSKPPGDLTGPPDTNAAPNAGPDPTYPVDEESES